MPPKRRAPGIPSRVRIHSHEPQIIEFEVGFLLDLSPAGLFDSLAHLHESPRQGIAILERRVVPPNQYDLSRLAGDDAVNRQSRAGCSWRSPCIPGEDASEAMAG